MKLTKICRECGTLCELNLPDEDVRRWQNGTLIQDAFPYLSDDEREIMISGMCGTCFDKMLDEQQVNTEPWDDPERGS